MQTLFLVNGAYKRSIAATDRGLQYGDGVWETLPVRLSRDNHDQFSGTTSQTKQTSCEAQFLSAHINRLEYGCQALGIPPPDRDLLVREIRQLCDDSLTPGQSAVLKIILTRGNSGRGYRPETSVEKTRPSRIITVYSMNERIKRYQKKGINLQLNQSQLSINPRLARFKHLNRLEQVLGSCELGEEIQEGLMCDSTGRVIEGTMSNLFIVTVDDAILTPEISDCGIQGVMRNEVIRWLPNLSGGKQRRVQVKTLTIDDVLRAKHLFMTNSLIGMWPVVSFDPSPKQSGKNSVKLPIATLCDEFNRDYLPKTYEPLTNAIQSGIWT